MLRRNWLELSRKLVDQYDLDYTLNAIAAGLDEAALSYWGEGVLPTTFYPNPFPITMSGSVLGGLVGNGIGYDVNGQITRIDSASPTTKTFLDPTSDVTNPRWDLLCISYLQTGDTPVPKPSDPITTIDLNLHDDFVLHLVPGTPSPTPAYPAKFAGSIVLAGIRVPAGATLGTQCTVDYSIRERAAAGIVQTPVFVDELLTGVVNGINTVFTLSQTPIGNPLIRKGPLVQDTSDWSIIGTTVTFTVAPAIGESPRAYYVAAVPSSQNPITSVFETLGVGDGVTTSFALTGLPANQDSTMAILDGEIEDPSVDWSLTQTPTTATINFSVAPAIGQKVSAFFFVNVGTSGNANLTGVQNEGSGGGVVGLFDTILGSVAKFKSLKPGANVTITDNLDGTVSIGATGGGGGGVETHGNAAAPILIDPTVGITPTAAPEQHWWVKPDVAHPGAQPVTAVPAIAAGSFVGQKISFYGTDAVNYLTLTHGPGVDLVDENGPVDLTNNQAIDYIWNGSNWFERNRRT